MNENKVLKNATWIIVCRIVQSILGLVVGALSSRYLGPSGYGLINYVASVVAFVVPIMQLGLNSTLVQEIVNNPEEEGQILGTSLTMSFFSSLITIAGVLSFIAVANKGEYETFIVGALYSFLLVAQSVELIQYWFQAKLKSKYVSIVMLISYAVVSVYKILLLTTNKNIYWFAVSQALDAILIAVSLLVLYGKLGGQKLSFSWGLVKRLFSKSKYYIISSLMVTIFAQTDRIMLKLMIDDSATGYYSAAATCSGITGFVFVALIDSARPSIFEGKKKGQQAYEKSLARLYSVIIYLSLLQCIVITLFAPLIVKILYGAQYISSISALRIIVWYSTFSYLGSVRNIWILAEGRQSKLWILNLSGALLNIVLNYFLIPIWGINGAAFASLITQIFTNVIMNQIIPSIRDVNRIMLKGCNPKYFFS